MKSSGSFNAHRPVGAAVVLVVVVFVSLVSAACRGPAAQTAGAAASPTASASAAAAAAAAAANSTPSAAPGSIVGLPGWLYYVDGSGRLLRLTAGGLVTVPGVDGWTANLSPDGQHIAYSGSNVIVTDQDGHSPRTLIQGSAGAGYEPAWSPDSTQILAAKGPDSTPQMGVITVATGQFTPLPHNLKGIHYLWSADGQHLGYATGTCQIAVADLNGANSRLVPVLGDQDTTHNPQRKRSCDPYSISPDGSLMAVDLHTGSMNDGDIARNLTANAVIDTRTGASVPLSVTGTITAVLFTTEGGMLIRSRSGSTNQLTLLSRQHTIITQVNEPPTTTNLRLLTRTEMA